MIVCAKCGGRVGVTGPCRKCRRIAADLIRYPADPRGYAERVRELEAEGLCTSDAQGAADVEFRRTSLRIQKEAEA